MVKINYLRSYYLFVIEFRVRVLDSLLATYYATSFLVF